MGWCPKVYLYDGEMCCMVMEDLANFTIMRYGLIDRTIYPNFVEHISDFMVKTLLLTSDVVMDHKEKKGHVKSFINPELCEITEDLVYTEPFNVGARTIWRRTSSPFINGTSLMIPNWRSRWRSSSSTL